MKILKCVIRYSLSWLKYLLIVGFIFLSNSDAEESNVVLCGIDADYNSKYVWRGIIYNDVPVIQPSVWFSLNDFTFSIWSNFIAGNEYNQGKIDETDFTLLYVYEWQKISFEPSINIYSYPNQEESPTTGESSLKISYPLGLINIYTEHSFDIMKCSGSYYAALGMELEHKISSRLSMNGSVSAGYGSSKFVDTYLDVSKTTLNTVIGSFSFTDELPLKFYIKPHLEINRILNNRLSKQVDKPTVVNVGIVVGKEF
ncbi:MAG: hypothetical protein V1833_03000 [Elusimicrobiota bacterium]